MYLHSLGAKTTGYSLPPPTSPSLFELCALQEITTTLTADVRNGGILQKALYAAAPEIVIHMAAQPLVRESYRSPVETYNTNVLGTVHVLDSVRSCPSVRAVVVVTSDKCYENREWHWGYRENDPLGGFDPYSSSKACAELVVSAFRQSFFNPGEYENHGVALASVRAGNVIGGGDWASDRLVPDCVRALLAGTPVTIRQPRAIRPWQHVLEPLTGYLAVAQKLHEFGPEYGEAWNFGPDSGSERTVEWIVKTLCERWGKGATYAFAEDAHLHEAHCLKLDSAKATARLGWHTLWDVEKTVEKVVEWMRAYDRGDEMRAFCLEQVRDYCSLSGRSSR